MELHHKLRRDPNWHPSGCNICGQLGHQAVNCTNGTINWRQIYGNDAFTLKPPMYPSDVDRRLMAKKIDFVALERSAREYAKAREGATLDMSVATTVKADTTPASAIATDAQSNPEGLAVKAEELPLAEGWATAQDGEGRTYFWHKVTKKVQWERPMADTPA